MAYLEETTAKGVTSIRCQVKIKVGGEFIRDSKTYTGETPKEIRAARAEAVAWGKNREAELKAKQSGKAPPGTLVFDLLQDYYDKVLIKRDRLAEEEGKKKNWHLNKVRALQGTFEKIGNRCTGKLIQMSKLASIPIIEISGLHIEEWCDERWEEVENETVRKDWGILRGAFERGIKPLGWITQNPMNEVDRPPPGKMRTRLPTDAEIAMLEEQLEYDPNKRPESLRQITAEVMKLCQETAMRSGELLSLTFGQIHVDAERSEAYLPKTKNGDARHVPMNENALAIVAKMRTPDSQPGDRIFPINASQRHDQFKKARERAGIQDLHFHDFRAWALTWMSKEVSILTLAEISGHRNINQLKTYYREKSGSIAARLNRPGSAAQPSA